MLPKGLILILEDNDDDVVILKRAFAKAGIKNPIIHLKDGQEGILYLSGEGIYADRQVYPLPCLILSDLKMPLLNGLEVLGYIRTKKELNYIPVIMLTSSQEDIDLQKAYNLHVNAFLTKPGNIDEYILLADELHKFWLKRNIAPHVKPNHAGEQ